MFKSGDVVIRIAGGAGLSCAVGTVPPGSGEPTGFRSMDIQQAGRFARAHAAKTGGRIHWLDRNGDPVGAE